MFFTCTHVHTCYIYVHYSTLYNVIVHYIHVNQHTKLHVHVRQLLHSLDMYMYTRQRSHNEFVIVHLQTILLNCFS